MTAKARNWAGRIKLIALTFGFCASVLSPVALAPVHTYAVDVIDPVCKTADPNNLPSVCKDNKGANTNPLYGPDGVLTKAMGLIAKVVGVVAVIGAIIAGTRMIVAGGDPSAVATARTALIYCLVAVVVAVAAQGIVSFVLSKI